MSTTGQNGTKTPLINTSQSAMEARLSARLEGVLEDIGQAYNSVEDRVHVLESTSSPYIQRLGKLEDSIQSYGKHEKMIEETVNELDGLKRSLESVKTGGSAVMEAKFQALRDEVTEQTGNLAEMEKKYQHFEEGIVRNTDGLAEVDKTVQALVDVVTKKMEDLAEMEMKFQTLVDQVTKKTETLTEMQKQSQTLANEDSSQSNVNASVQTLLVRVSELETRVKSSAPKESVPSTNELAQALIDRFARGDAVDNETLVRLREVLPAAVFMGADQDAALRPALAPAFTVPASRDVSKRASATPQRKRTFDQSYSDNTRGGASRPEASPRKRARVGRPRADAHKPLRSVGTTQANEAIAENGNSQGTPENAIAGNDLSIEQSAEFPDIRRSTRPPKPTKKASYLTWTEVRDRRKTR